MFNKHLINIKFNKHNNNKSLENLNFLENFR